MESISRLIFTITLPLFCVVFAFNNIKNGLGRSKNHTFRYVTRYLRVFLIKQLVDHVVCVKFCLSTKLLFIRGICKVNSKIKRNDRFVFSLFAIINDMVYLSTNGTYTMNTY